MAAAYSTFGIQTDDSKNASKAQAIIEARDGSARWLHSAYRDQWLQVWKNYKCEPDAFLDQNGNVDQTRISVGTPDTWAYIQRVMARVTANLPVGKFRAKDKQAAEQITLKCMRDYDKGHTFRQNRRHVLQALLFGWSVRQWWWRNDTRKRKKWVNPATATPEDRLKIVKQYGGDMAVLLGQDPMQWTLWTNDLLIDSGRNGRLAIEYDYTPFEGAASDVLFIGDCFPEAGFTDFYKQERFIVARRRTKKWLLDHAEAYKKELGAGIASLLEKCPNGDPVFGPNLDNSIEAGDLRWDLAKALEQDAPEGHPAHAKTQGADDRAQAEPTWRVLECHYPGENARICYVHAAGSGKEAGWIGEIPYPYELEGQLAFTNLEFIPDLLFGVGDATARILRGLQVLKSRESSLRFEVSEDLNQPAYGTLDNRIYDNPEKFIKRTGPFKLVKMLAKDEIFPLDPNPHARANLAQTLNTRGVLAQDLQMGFGESNLSLMSGQAPDQARTATGARVMAYNTDILSAFLIAGFAEAIAMDYYIIYMLNRSEMAEPVSFVSDSYLNRLDPQHPAEPSLDKETWAEITPESMQYDAEVVVAVNSMLADQDDANVQAAQMLWQASGERPELINPRTAAENLLIAYGKGRELEKWMVKPPPPSPPPPPNVSASVSFKGEGLPPNIQKEVLVTAGAIKPDSPWVGETPEPPMPVPGEEPPPEMLGPASIDIPPQEEDPMFGAATLAAARGQSMQEMGGLG